MLQPSIWSAEEEQLLHRLLAQLDTEIAQAGPLPSHNLADLHLEDYVPPPRSLWQDIWSLQGTEEQDYASLLSSEEQHREKEEQEEPIAGPSHSTAAASPRLNSIASLVPLLETTYAEIATRQSIRASLVDVLTRILSSDTHSKDAAAEELAELLGFEHLDLVADVLQHPDEAIQALLGTAPEMAVLVS